MDFIKGAMGGKVDKIIDQAANLAKEKVEAIIGGQKKKAEDAEDAEDAKDKKAEGGIGDMLSGVIGKAATDAATDKAADQVLSFGKSLFK